MTKPLAAQRMLGEGTGQLGEGQGDGGPTADDP
jgi:hypothetical protein